MIVGGLADALRRLDALLARVCDAEERRAQRLYTVEKGWDSLRASLVPTADSLAFDGGVPEGALAIPGTIPALTRLVEALRLTPLEADALVVLLAPYLEPRYGKLYTVLQDEPGTTLVTERLLFTVLGRTPARATALAAALAPDGRLVAPGVVVRATGHHAALAAPIALAAEVRDALLGMARPSTLDGTDLTWREGADELDLDAPPLQVVWGAGERDDVAAEVAGPDLLVIRLERAPAADTLERVWRSAILHAATAVVDVAALGGDEAAAVGDTLHRQVRRHGGRAVVSSATPLALPVRHHEAPSPGFVTRRLMWATAASEHGATLDDAALDLLAGNHPVSRQQLASIFAAVTALDVDQLNQAAYRLRRVEVRHARLVPVGRSFDDLVLRPSTREALERLVYYVSARDQVASARGLESRYRMQRGPVALFAGRSGTGKTLAAEVVANAVGRPLAVVDLSRLVSKYIGETEKHIDEILRAGERSGAVLFFDEADALFSARTDVSSSNDRYANLEVGYLLQRIEQHDGLVILATNLQHAIDEAFLRRFQARIEFPFPDACERRQIWDLMLAGRQTSIDVERLALNRLAGGDIRNAALKAVFLAEREAAVLSQRHVERAVALEMYELGRLSRFDPEVGDQGATLRELALALETELEGALRRRFLKEIHFVHGAPTKEAIAGKRPAVSLAMFRVASASDGGLRLGLIVSAWSNRSEEELELLGVLLELLTQPAVASVCGRSLRFHLQKSFDFDLLHRFWSSHGHPMRPSLMIDVEID